MRDYLFILAGAANLWLTLALIGYALEVPFIGWLLGLLALIPFILIGIYLINLMERN